MERPTSTGMSCAHRSSQMLTALCQKGNAEARDTGSEFDDELISILHEHTFGPCLVTLRSEELAARPILAEMYAAGQWRLCLITGLEPPSNDKATTSPPKVQVFTVPLTDEEESNVGFEAKMVGLGDITTIWQETEAHELDNLLLQDRILVLKNLLAEAQEELRSFPVHHCELSIQKLYESRIDRHLSKRNNLTKKQIPKIAAAARNPARAEEVLRNALKAGPGMRRVVNSATAEGYLYSGNALGSLDALRRRLVGAEMLSVDSRLGGRFKRSPCISVSARYEDGNGAVNKKVKQVTVLNGGWLALDSGNRAGAEARKFAERASPSATAGGFDGPTRRSTSLKNGEGNYDHVKPTSTPVQLMTAADERIASRLECLAMGERFGRSNGVVSNEEERRVEVDVRETLRSLGLPVSSDGAREALIRIGRWSEHTSASRNNVMEPWPEKTLETAHSLAKFEKDRRRRLQEACTRANEEGSVPVEELEGRVNLSGIPCVCVDAKGTAFRDDAIGVRPRSSTGREVVESVSKWEVLVHISDCSDIFSPKLGNLAPTYDPLPLHEAAERRGYSRYDLPLGPLHLMPPVALKALSLVPAKMGNSSPTTEKDSVNRCVTLWAYIDEKSGRLVDAGVERTIISAPVAFTYKSATSVLNLGADANTRKREPDPTLEKARAILQLAERNLSLWSKHQRKTNKAAELRHQRMAAKEIASRATINVDVTSGGSPFQYSRGHKIVDSALDLYGHALTGLLRRAKAPIPAAPGRGADRRGRLGTAPLRRYIDGIAQRQALSVLCSYGGPPLTREECNKAHRSAAKASNAINTIRSVKKKASHDNIIRTSRDQVKTRNALRSLSSHLAGIGGGKRKSIKAISTGRQNEVVLEGAGIKAKCGGVEGTLSPGERVLVDVVKLDPEKGRLSIKLAGKWDVN